MWGGPSGAQPGIQTPLLFRQVCLFLFCVCLCVLVCVCVCTACSCGPWQTFSLPPCTSRVNVPSARALHQVFPLPAVFAGLGRQAAGRARLQGLHARAWAHGRVLLAHSMCNSCALHTC